MTLWGLSWNKVTGIYTRLASATGKTPGANFDSLTPWQWRRCNLWDDGTVSYYHGTKCYSDLNVANVGQAMTEFNKCWYLTDYTSTPNVYKWYVSDDSNDSVIIGGTPTTVKLHPAFMRNGVVQDHIYWGSYEGYINPVTGMLESKAQVQPTADLTIDQFRTAAQARGTGWHIQDFLSTCLVQLLSLVEFGGFDLQSLLSVGVTTPLPDDDGATSYGAITGRTSGSGWAGTTDLGNTSGEVVYITPADGVTTEHAFSIRGAENVYGSLYKFVDGIDIRNYQYMVFVADHDFVTCNPNSDYPWPPGDPGFDGTIYQDDGTTIAGILPPDPLQYDYVIGYPTDLAFGSTLDYAFLGSTLSPTPPAVGLPDAFVSNGWSNAIATFGGGWSSSTDAGMFYWNMSNAPGSTMHTRRIGTRLTYLGV